MGNIRKSKFFTLALVGVAVGFGPACDGGGAPVDGSGGAPSGGAVGSGGKTNAGGSKPSGGNASTGGKVNTGGGSPAGGSAVGGGEATTGGMGGVVSTGGADATGGVVTTGGADATGGVSESGGMGGDGMGGDGMGGAGPEPCGGCLKLTVPLAQEADQTTFQVDLGTAVDLSTLKVTFRLKTESLGTAGSFQFFATDTGYHGNYKGYTAFVSDFTSFVVEFGQPGGYTSPDYDSTLVRYIGIAIEGAPANGTFGETTVLVDSIHFENSVSADQSFDTGVQGWGINNYVTNVAGSTVTQVP